MNDSLSRGSGNGCLWLVIVGVGLAMLLVMSGGGSGDEPGNTTNTRSGTLSGNQVEVLSRNQLNLWSDVRNCYGDYSCMQVISTTTSTVENTTSTRNDVSGDRNTITTSDGQVACENPDAPGQYSPYYCQQGTP